MVEHEGRPAVGRGGEILPGAARADALPLLARVPALPPERLGDPAFRKAHGLRYAYVAGEIFASHCIHWGSTSTG